MAQVIAMAGKGGTGKTTTTALLLKYLRDRGLPPILAGDADANANLNELLAIKVESTLGEIRRDMKGDIPAGMSRDQFMEMRIHQSLTEEKGYDLLVMGQPDGPGCYCAANQYLAMSMDRLSENYRYIVVDNEAGMEHLSRMNLRLVDYLLVVSDPSARGILTARRIADLSDSLQLQVRKRFLIVNRAPEPLSPALQAHIDEAVAEAKLPLGGIIPASEELVQQELARRSYLDLPDDSPILRRVYAMFDTIFG